MPQITAHDEVRDKRTYREVEEGRHRVYRTDFLVAPKERPELPQAFLIESTPGRLLPTHFHEVDQFQVVVSGGGTLSRHALSVPGVHFARGFTPYGPIRNGAGGIGFMTLRARRDVMDAQFITERRWRLDEVPDRKPWQFTQMPRFPRPAAGASVIPLEGMTDGRGLGVWSVTVQADAETLLPAPTGGDGQFVVMLKGNLLYQGREYRGLTVAYLAPEEAALRLRAGGEGLEALVLNFPARVPPPARALKPKQGTETWHCTLCDFVYDEAEGLPSEGIAAGTRWADVPHDWTCPDCSAAKDGFEKLAF